MPRFARSETLSRVSKGLKSEYQAWGEGLHLERSSGRTIQELQHRAVADRLSLARDHLSAGRRVLALTPPANRCAVSRFYYAMYHASRATCLFHHGGDDYEK